MKRKRKAAPEGFSLRISAGEYYQRRLEAAPGVRPAMERVREAVFSMLGPVVEGARVLDCFAGSGAYGLEALSRGAAEAVFIESNAEACEAVRRNLSHCGVVEPKGRVICSDVFSTLSSYPGGPFDLVFADPPYREAREQDWLGKALQALEAGSMLSSNAWMIWEAEPEVNFPDRPGWISVRDRCYGRSRIHLFRRVDPT